MSTSGGAGPAATSTILAGSTSTDGTDIITIPAGKTWIGTVWISTFIAGTSAANAGPWVDTQGTGVTPSANTVVCSCKVAIPTVAAGADAQNTTVVPSVVVRAPAGNTVTLRAHKDTSTGFSAGCVGTYS